MQLSNRSIKLRRTAGFAGLFLLACPVTALADDPSFSIVLKNKQFVPSEVQIPAGVKVKLVVRNENPTASEFESHPISSRKGRAPRSGN